VDRRFWHLVVQFALKDFKIRYTHSVLGYAWSVLHPLVFSIVYYFVCKTFLHFDAANFPGYLLLGMMLWAFFSEGSGNGIGSLLARSSVISKVPLQREAIVYAAILNALITLAINLVILGVLLTLAGERVIGWSLATLPVTLLELILLTTGIALLLAPLHVRYHDVGYLWSVLLQIGFWMTPIIYVDKTIPARLQWMIVYNPMTRIITQGREAIVYQTFSDPKAMLHTFLIAGTVMLFGSWVFRRMQPRLVEYL